MVCLREHCPAAWMFKLKCLCSGMGIHSDLAQPWMTAGKKKINTSPPRCWPSQEMFCKTYDLFTWLPHLLPHLCSVKETDIQTLIRLSSGTLIGHLLRHPTFQIKQLFLASTPWFLGLLCGQQTGLGFAKKGRIREPSKLPPWAPVRSLESLRNLRIVFNVCLKKTKSGLLVPAQGAHWSGDSSNAKGHVPQRPQGNSTDADGLGMFDKNFVWKEQNPHNQSWTAGFLEWKS